MRLLILKKQAGGDGEFSNLQSGVANLKSAKRGELMAGLNYEKLRLKDNKNHSDSGCFTLFIFRYSDAREMPSALLALMVSPLNLVRMA
jgi:hypothetical protein